MAEADTELSPPRRRKITKKNKPLDINEKEAIVNLYKKLTRESLGKVDIINEIGATLGMIWFFL